MTREFRAYGPPGTGKTTWIGRQAELAASKYSNDAVVIASLTKAAAFEIASRLPDIPKRNVGTLHAHAWVALNRPKIAESTEGLKLWNESRKSRSDRIEARNAALNPENAPLEAALPQTEAEDMLGQLAVLRQRMQPEELWPMRVRRFAAKWREFKETTGMIDFTDLIERAYDEIDVHPAKPAAFFLDEAQDMSRLEMRLARKWGEECSVFVIVGDPYQNLYQWRGSDPEAFTAGEVSGTIVLDQSWRVPRLPQEYAVRFVKNIRSEDPFPEYKPKPEEGELRFRPHTWNYPEPLIADMLKDDGEVMILASCSYMLTPLVAALRERGIPFHNPYRNEHGGWNPLRYADRVRAFMRPTLDGHLWTMRDLKLFTEPLKAKETMKYGAKSMIELYCEPDRFGDDSHADEPIKPAKLSSYFEDSSLEKMIEQDLDWLVSSTRASRASVVEYAARVAKEDPRKLNETPRIIIGTIHSVKGGEADSVFVFPDLSRRGYNAWNRAGADRDAIYRQFYVALTRTKDKLTILDPNGSEYVPFPRQ